MERYLLRTLELVPVTTEKSADQQTKQRIQKLFSDSYLIANIFVRECLHQFWNSNLADIPYLNRIKELKPIEKEIENLNARMNQTGISGEEKNRLRSEWKSKLNEKKKLVNHDIKHEFADEVKSWEMLKSVGGMFPHFPENMLHRTLFQVAQDFLRDLESVKSGKRQLRMYAKGFPLYFSYDQNFKPFFFPDSENRKKVHFRFIEGMEFKVELGRDKSENRKLIEMVLADDQNGYKLLGDSHLIVDKRKNKFFLFQTFKLPIEETETPEFTPNLALGVDLGYKVPIAWALSDKTAADILGDGEKIRHQRETFQARLSKAQIAATDVKGGHGQKNKTKSVDDLRGKERDYFKQLNRRLAKELVDIAVKYRAGIIRLELLNFSKKRDDYSKGRHRLNSSLSEKQITKEWPSLYDRFLAMFQKWSYSQLIGFIKERAQKEGISVLFVDPVNTSKLCSECLKHGIRSTQEFLEITKREKCDRGGCPAEFIKENKKEKNFIHSIPADKNAAINIARTENVITDKEEYSKRREEKIAESRQKKEERLSRGNQPTKPKNSQHRKSNSNHTKNFKVNQHGKVKKKWNGE